MKKFGGGRPPELVLRISCGFNATHLHKKYGIFNLFFKLFGYRFNFLLTNGRAKECQNLDLKCRELHKYKHW